MKHRWEWWQERRAGTHPLALMKRCLTCGVTGRKSSLEWVKPCPGVPHTQACLHDMGHLHHGPPCACAPVHFHLAAGVYACGTMSPPVLPNVYDWDSVTCGPCLKVRGGFPSCLGGTCGWVGANGGGWHSHTPAGIVFTKERVE